MTFLTSEVGIGSKLHDLEFSFTMITNMSPTEGSKNEVMELILLSETMSDAG